MNKNKNPIIKLEKLSISYGKEKIIENLDLSIKPGTFVSIIGANGSGKSTIIKAIMGLIPYKGEILFKEKSIKEYKTKELSKNISYVPQMHQSKGEVTVFDYISFGRLPYSGSFFLKKEDKIIINNIIEKMNLTKLKDKIVNNISGGQRQKVALAAALVQETEVVILDEPTTYLDLKNQYEILEISKLLHSLNKTVILVLHDLNQAIKYSDEIVLLKDKRVFNHDSPEKVLTPEVIKKIYDVDVSMQVIDGKKYISNVDTNSIIKEVKWF